MDKTKAYTPSGRASWTSKLSAEFLGTIFLTWMIGLLGVTFSGVKFESLISFGDESWISHLTIGWWVALDVLICLAVFSRWSCDLNPAVTTYRMISGQHSKKYGFSKIGIQILAALVAGALILGTQELAHYVSQNSQDDAYAPFKSMKDVTGYTSNMSAFTIDDENLGLAHHSTTGRHLLAFMGEFFGTFILMWPIFTKSIKSAALKDLLIVVTVGFGVAALLELGTVGWNPARTLATNYIYDIAHGGTGAMKLYWAYALGPIAAAFALYYTQIGFTKYVAPAWEKWLTLGQVKDK